MKHVTFHLPSFLRRVRIHGGEFDSSARAMNRVSEKSSLMTYESAIHAQAEPRIVRGSTIERKHMSTKTTFKRIALVAVAALGFGVLSVVPSQAAAGPISLAVVQNGTASLTPATGTGETATAAIFTVSSLLTAGDSDSLTVSFLRVGTPPTGSNVKPLMAFLDSTTAASGPVKSRIGSTLSTAYAAGESVTATNAITLFANSSSQQLVAARMGIFLESSTAAMLETRTAGVYNFLVVAQGYTNGVINPALQQTLPVSITIAAAPVAALPIPSAANATAYLQAKPAVGSASFTGVATDSVTAGSFVAGTEIGSIRITNLTTGNLAANDTVTVSMTGAGYLVTTAGPTSAITGRSFTVVNVAGVTANIFADGTAGTGTITVTTGAGASFVKTVTFFDTRPVTATAVVAKAFIKAGATTQDVFAVTVRDTLGNAITNQGVSVTAAPSDTRTTQVVGSATAATCTWNVRGAAYHCPITGAAADKFGPVAYTITATGTGINSAVVVRTSATTTFADNVATKAILAGPSTGTPGATVEYTLTLTEKNGYPVADQTYGVDGAGGALFSTATADRPVSGWSAANAPFLASESFTSKSGVITSEGTLPIAGTASLTLTLIGDGITTTGAIDKTIGKTKVTASTEVTNPGVDAATDAANEATDAANAATDAALAAAEAADAATSAAQEASDAVAALSESVTKLIAGLQAQIKSLAAVVAKIAKKVKA
jgi:trimeric autotransporter adhesin